MNKPQKRSNSLKIAVILIVLFLLLTLSVCFIDVKPIGPEGSKVGFAALNGAFSQLIGVNIPLYHFTEALGILAFLPPLLFATIGAIQLITRRSLRKVDTNLLALAVLYIITAALYLFFEAVVINYRPVVFDSGLEASFPSSHTILAIVFIGSAIMQFYRRTSGRLRSILITVCITIVALIVLGRLFSGVHWLTDILGGALLGSALLSLYYAAAESLGSLRENQKKRNVTAK